jgi:hypothetical protein
MRSGLEVSQKPIPQGKLNIETFVMIKVELFCLLFGGIFFLVCHARWVADNPPASP